MFKSWKWEDFVLPILVEFAKDPTANVHTYGKTTGSCCFCNRKLTDKQSIATGYGETCAKHYGLEYPLSEAEDDDAIMRHSVGQKISIITIKNGYFEKHGIIVEVLGNNEYLVEVEGMRYIYEHHDLGPVSVEKQELPF